MGSVEDGRTDKKWPQVQNKQRAITRKARIINIRDVITHLQVKPRSLPLGFTQPTGFSQENWVQTAKNEALGALI